MRIGLRDVFRLLRLSNDCKTEYISGKAKASYKVIQRPVWNLYKQPMCFKSSWFQTHENNFFFFQNSQALLDIQTPWSLSSKHESKL